MFYRSIHLTQTIYGVHYDIFQLGESNQTTCIDALRKAFMDSFGTVRFCDIIIDSMNMLPLYGPTEHKYIESGVLVEFTLHFHSWMRNSNCSGKCIMDNFKKSIELGLLTAAIRKRSSKNVCKSTASAHTAFNPDYNISNESSDFSDLNMVSIILLSLVIVLILLAYFNRSKLRPHYNRHTGNLTVKQEKDEDVRLNFKPKQSPDIIRHLRSPHAVHFEKSSEVLLDESSERHRSTLLRLIRSCRIFMIHFDDVNEFDVLDRFEYVNLRAGDIVYESDRSSEMFIFIESGDLLMEVCTANKILVPKKKHCTYTAGQFFDTISCSKGNSTMMIKAVKESVLWKIKLKSATSPSNNSIKLSFEFKETTNDRLDIGAVNKAINNAFDDQSPSSARSIDLYSTSDSNTRTMVDHRNKNIVNILVSAIRNAGVFDCSSDEKINDILDNFESLFAYKGDIIIHQNDTAQYFYVIESGLCSSSVQSDDGTIMKSKTKFKAGSYFGEYSYKYDCRREMTIKADTDCVLWRIKPNINLQYILTFRDKNHNRYDHV
jgi:hypothetical protein